MGPLPDLPQSPRFQARRMTHEMAIHRADAVLALGQKYRPNDAVAVDALDGWLELGSLPVMLQIKPQTRELLGSGRTVHLHATDVGPALGAEWVVDLTGDRLRWRRAHEKCAVAVRGPLSELLRTVVRRRTLADADVEVIGDADLLAFWLERVPFG